MSHVILHTDGGARGNPGPAGIGVVVEVEDGGRREMVAEIGEKIGVATNNVAEYRALIRGLEEAGRVGGTLVTCLLDSQLVVEQMNGRFKVKHENVIPLHRKATELSRRFKRVTYGYVPRAQNAGADALVNAALDGTLARAGARAWVVEPEMDFNTSAQSLPRDAPREAAIEGALELVSRAFRDAIEIPRVPLEELNRRLPEALRYAAERDVWRERWAVAKAVGHFAVATGMISDAELEILEREFSELRPGGLTER